MWVSKWWELTFIHCYSLFKICSFEREREGGRETLNFFFPYGCIHWLVPACALTGMEPATLSHWDDSLSTEVPGQGKKKHSKGTRCAIVTLKLREAQCLQSCCLSSKSRGIVGQWLSSSLGRQLCTAMWGPGGGCCSQSPRGEGLHCFLLLNPTYVSFSCTQGFVGLRPPLSDSRILIGAMQQWCKAHFECCQSHLHLSHYFMDTKILYSFLFLKLYLYLKCCTL